MLLKKLFVIERIGALSIYTIRPIKLKLRPIEIKAKRAALYIALTKKIGSNQR